MSDYSLYLLLEVIATLGAVYLGSLYLRSQTFKLRHIPTLGSPGIIGSYFDGLKYFQNGHEIVQECYKKFYGTLFKVSDMGRYHVIVSEPEMINDIRRARDDQLSFDDAVADVRSNSSMLYSILTLFQFIQTDHTLGREVRVDPFLPPVFTLRKPTVS